MARIAGVDLPAKKRAAIGLTYIYGIGRTRALSLLHRAGVDEDKKVAELSEEEVNHLRTLIESEGAVQGDVDERKAPDGDGLLSRSAPPAWAACPRPAHSHQRAHPKGSKARHCG